MIYRNLVLSVSPYHSLDLHEFIREKSLSDWQIILAGQIRDTILPKYEDLRYRF